MVIVQFELSIPSPSISMYNGSIYSGGGQWSEKYTFDVGVILIV